MTTLCWNCRGLGNPSTVGELYRKVKEKCPGVVFLMETKLHNKKMARIKQKMGFNNMLTVDCVGRSGGLALLWKDEMGIEIINYSRRHIHAKVNQANLVPWFFTGFYGHPEAQKRCEAWDLLRFLKTKVDGPWLCAGDFNEILVASEKVGGRQRPSYLMENFRSTLEFCGLHELQCNGPVFTWDNGQVGGMFTKEKLDRAVANHEWHDLFPSVVSSVEVTIFSDHLSLNIDPWGRSKQQRKRRIFRYEANWGKVHECKEVIKKIWRVKTRDHDTWNSVKKKLQESRVGLRAWQCKNDRKVGLEINQVSEMVRQEKNKSEETDGQFLKELQLTLKKLQEEDDLYWKQRAKVDWMRSGDQNTKFFHASANQKKKNKYIYSISDEHGNLRETQEQVEDAFVHFFTQLFKAEAPSNMMQAVEAIQPCVTPAMNDFLVKDFTIEEVGLALNQMAPLKAPGPDGFSADFYQKNWGNVGGEVSKAVIHMLNNGSMNKDINSTYIALIPKIANPTCVTEFRPISLCNVFYKLVAKTLANRLKSILPDIIAPNQSAFIPGRLISDNVLIAYETLHTMHSRMWGKVGYMAVKLDMSKAYDRVEWDFLEAVMYRMGFGRRWIAMIMMCVKTANFEILVNGIPTGRIHPSRGIRQGDPISPYLFLLCAEALSSLLTQADHSGVLSGVPTSKKGPKLNHLFFADDSLLFCKATPHHWRKLTSLLHTYELASGQRLNQSKTSIFFSRNTTTETRQEILRMAGIPSTQSFDKYLGLPSLVGKSRNQAFKNIKERIWGRLNDWKLKFLSQAGKEILLKAVIQAIPTYSMSIFLLPKGLCAKINSMMQKFWWGHQENDTRIH
jgi:hypothetical protein